MSLIKWKAEQIYNLSKISSLFILRSMMKYAQIITVGANSNFNFEFKF